ncbi:MAG: CapA family protein [Lachnospiraceae bacterium]|nr:CapA family protein [Lachnospiraceae bacterium]
MKKIIMSVVLCSLVLICGCSKENDTQIKMNESNNSNVNDKTQELYSDSEDSGAITLVFGGDVLLSESMTNTYNKDGGNVENILSPNLLSEFKNADIAMVNQEFPFSLRGTKMEDKQYTFRTDPKYISIFEEMGVDIVSLANNHTLDFGTDALIDTLDTYNNSDMLCGGAGRNMEEAKEVKYIERKGKKVAFLCASRVIPVTDWNATGDRAGMLTTYDPKILLEQIEIAKDSADYAVVYVHWGKEHQEYPEEYQKTLARQYIDAGADAVIGCHTHCLQGAEIYNNKPIIYSLGNFMFGGTIDRTMMVKITLDDNIETQVIPCVEKAYLTSIVEDDNLRKEFYDYYKGISFDVDIDDKGNVINLLN